jgi:heme/copper-type cytochrome/quinol oxidase subunit 2
LIAVNPDRRESDLAAIPDDVLKLWSGSAGTTAPADEAAAAAEATDHISSLWWWVMLLVLTVAVAGSVLASRYLGTQREQP